MTYFVTGAGAVLFTLTCVWLCRSCHLLLHDGHGADTALHRLIRSIADLPPSEEERVFGRDGQTEALALLVSAGRCPVCGEALDESVVLCRACLTPHHRRCFRWNEKCAMYACGTARFYHFTPTVRACLEKAR